MTDDQVRGVDVAVWKKIETVAVMAAILEAGDRSAVFTDGTEQGNNSNSSPKPYVRRAHQLYACALELTDKIDGSEKR